MGMLPGQPRHLYRWALLLVCLAAFFLRFQGINWPAFHPDEHPVGGWVDKAARVTVEVKLSDAFAGYTPETIALGLETAMQWHPGALPLVGSREPVVPFADLLRQ